MYDSKRGVTSYRPKFIDVPRVNALTGQLAVADYRNVINAVGRRDQVRVLIDGITAANDLGLTNAVPGQVIVHTDGRLRSIVLGNLTIRFKRTAPSKLYWAGHPAMRFVQVLYWLRDGLKVGTLTDQEAIKAKRVRLLQESDPDKKFANDLRAGLPTVPSWMQGWIREVLARAEEQDSGQQA